MSGSVALATFKIAAILTIILRIIFKMSTGLKKCLLKIEMAFTRRNKTRKQEKQKGGETLAARNYGKVISARQAELNALRQIPYSSPKNGPTYATLKANNARGARNAELAALRGRRSVKNMVAKSAPSSNYVPMPNKKWFNYRTREGRSGTWTGSFSTVPGKNVYRVKNCGNGGRDPVTGLCKVKQAAHAYKYVA